jgi:hypothetical protein
VTVALWGTSPRLGRAAATDQAPLGTLLLVMSL